MNKNIKRVYEYAIKYQVPQSFGEIWEQKYSEGNPIEKLINLVQRDRLKVHDAVFYAGMFSMGVCTYYTVFLEIPETPKIDFVVAMLVSFVLLIIFQCLPWFFSRKRKEQIAYVERFCDYVMVFLTHTGINPVVFQYFYQTQLREEAKRILIGLAEKTLEAQEMFDTVTHEEGRRLATERVKKAWSTFVSVHGDFAFLTLAETSHDTYLKTAKKNKAIYSN